jgi:hypothetical protein
MKNIMLKIVLIFIIFLYAVPVQQQDNKYPKKLIRFDGRPTTLAIDLYVNSLDNQKNFIREFEQMVKDTIYNDIFFRTETPKKKTEVLAYNNLSLSSSCEIVVNNREVYRALEYDSTKEYIDNDYFLKATIFHEISHYYFCQVILEMQKVRGVEVNEYYAQGITMFPNQEMQYGAKFIEEGFCEYFIQRFRLSQEFQNILVPEYKSDLQDINKNYEYQYMYASKFLKEFMDISIELEYSHRLKWGLMIILHNRPPNYQEILKPELYFNRLKLLN